jgi:hypothetical protein
MLVTEPTEQNYPDSTMAQKFFAPDVPFRHLALTLIGVIPWLWLGLVGGISLIETPIRFRTPPITRDGAAMLGVAIFHALAYVELCFLILLMTAVVLLRQRSMMLIVGTLGLIVAIEHAVIVPFLEIRARLLLEGIQPEPSSVHAWAMVFEASKMLILATLGVLGWRKVIQR